MLHILQGIVSNLDWLVIEVRQTTGAGNSLCVCCPLKRDESDGPCTVLLSTPSKLTTHLD